MSLTDGMIKARVLSVAVRKNLDDHIIPISKSGSNMELIFNIFAKMQPKESGINSVRK